jgi:hypothetical protein
MDILSKHPLDWLTHFILCLVPVWHGWCTWFVAAFVAIGVEYEQWSYAGRPPLSQYFWHKMFGDLVADTVGIIGGVLLCRLS